MEQKTIVLAGGCFWGLEKLYSSLKGVIKTTVGYANGSGEEDANYKTVCTGKTGFREAVEVVYDPAVISLKTILFDFFQVIDPSLENQQGHDVGTQYQTGIYYTDDDEKNIIDEVAAIEKRRSPVFKVEIEPLKNFYPAEEYHQKYLDKNPGGYCHIPVGVIQSLAASSVDAGAYEKPDEATLKKTLTPEEYQVTQNAATEAPYSNKFFRHQERGIYVDKVTGEPLFSSKDKYLSNCGWPAFTKSIDPGVVVGRRDLSHGMDRIEVRSRAGDSHLGHVFDGDPESPNGIRFCINSAALRFIPYDKMKEEGYGDLMSQV